MDFFDVLRQGCAFGGASRSKKVHFTAPAASSAPVEPAAPSEKARRVVPGVAASLDFFGAGDTDKPAAEQKRPDDTKGKEGKRKRGDFKWNAGAEKEESEPAAPLARDDVAGLRRRHRIHVDAGAPDPMATFDTMEKSGVAPWLVRNMRGLGFANPTAIQMQTFPAVLAGGHVLGSAPTGSGKTIAFLGPLLARLGKPGKEFARVVIIDPTRELAKQTLDEFVKLTTGRKWSGRVLDRLTKTSAQSIKRLDVAVATPMRLAQMLREDVISLDKTRHLVLDEADKLLDLGFAPQVDEILSFLPKGSEGQSDFMQTLLFSATMPPSVIELANSILVNPMRITIGNANAGAVEIDQKLLFITNEDGKLYTFRQLVQEGKVKPPVLIFVQSKDRAKELFGELVYDGLLVDVIHADRTKQQRDNTVAAFRTGKIWMMICTDLMARGVDFKGVETVINYDFPQSASTYIHRIGRTGRAGRSGKAITMFTIDDFESLRSIVGVMRQSGCEVPEWMLRLKAKNKKERRMAEWRPPTRKRISTISGYDLAKSHKKRQMIETTQKERKRPRKKSANGNTNE